MFGPSDRRNTLRPVSLVYCIDVYDLYDLYDLDRLSPEGGPYLSLYSLEEQGFKVSILFGIIQCLAVHAE